MDKFKAYVIIIVIMLSGLFTIPHCIDYLSDVSTEQGFVEDLETKEYSDEINNYTITYYLDGGTAINPDKYNLFTETFTLNYPNKLGYEFLGWTGTDLNDKTMNVTICQGSAGNLEFTAHYKSIKLNTPNLAYVNDSILWTPIENAVSYTISVNDNLITVNSPTISCTNLKQYFVQGDNYIKVKAVSPVSETCDSEWSNILTISENQTWYGFVSDDKSTILSWNELIELGYAKVNGSILTSFQMQNTADITYSGDLYISEDITEIGNNCFFIEYSIKNVFLPNTVTTIGTGNFVSCENLVGVYVPASVITIKGACFKNCAENSKVYCEVKSQPENWDLRSSTSTFVYGYEFKKI